MYSNPCSAMKTVLRGKTVTLNTYIKFFQRSQINTLKMYVKYLEKQNRQHWNMGIINQNQD